MNCNQFQYLLYDYLDNDLNVRYRVAFETHLQTCEHCRKALLAEKRLSKKLFEANKSSKTGFSFSGIIKNILRQNDLMIR